MVHIRMAIDKQGCDVVTAVKKRESQRILPVAANCTTLSAT